MRTKRQPAGTAVSVFRRVPIAAAVAVALSQGAMAATYTVTNGNASGAGSLSQAISDANANCATDLAPIIQFGGPFTIAQSTPLPAFICFATGAYTPTIDGFTSGAIANSDSSGWNANVAVAIDGSSDFYGGACAVQFQDFGGYGGYLTINGIEVRNFNYGSTSGICGRVKIGGSILRNISQFGIEADSGSVIGGPALAQRNLLASNGFGDIEFDGAITITNNLIGMDFDGTPYVSASDYGITWCGCNTPSGTISGNTIVANYVGIDYSSDSAITISGNRIGMDPTGASAMSAGGSYGISAYNAHGTISGNVIGGFSTAISLGSSSAAVISGNKIGTTGDGSASTGSVYTGVDLYFNYGTRVDSNLISGTLNTGVYLENSSNTVVYGNLIGTDASGNAALGGYFGIYIGLSAANNTIDSNVIAGNFTGIYSSDASFTTFSNNRIGVGTSGTAIPNGFGFRGECGTNLSIINNLIASNSYGGMDLEAIQNSVIQGNRIDSNQGYGVTLTYTTCGGGAAVLAPKALTFGIDNDSSDNQVLANTITSNNGNGIFIEGGSGNAMSQNVIHSNAVDGILIDARFDSYGAVPGTGIGNSMLGNLVHNNANKNINLAFASGPRFNDPFDADGGPNNGQNYPVISAVSRDTVNNQTTIGFDLDSKAGDYLVEFFSNASPGIPAGQESIGTTFMSLATDGSAPGSFTVGRVDVDYISATATRVGPEKPAVQDTSELSPEMSAKPLPVPAASVFPSSIDFGDVVVGRSSGTSAVTVASQGTADYIVRSLREDSCTGPAICVSGAFACSTTCTDGSAWSPNSSCTITASFAPSVLGSQTKTLALCDNTVASPRTITFKGNGVPPPTVDISWSPSSWAFGEVLVGLQSSSKSFTLTNAGASVVYLGSPTTSNPDFVITGNSCGATLAAGATCATDVAFSPTSRGGVNASLQIVGSNVAPASAAALRSKATTATTSTASALLQASGAQFGELRLPASLSFGTFVLHSDPGQLNVELRNTGNGPIAISNITVSGPFTMTNDCGTTLAPGAACTIVVKFNPATLGTANGVLNVVTDAAGGARAIALTASVIADARPVVRISPTLLGFGNRQIGSQSAAQRVTITNEGSQTANLLPLVMVQPESGGTGEAKNEFILTSTCGATLAPQATCFADIVFRALGFGERKGELQVPSNSADSPQKATLGGTGCRPFVAGINRSGRDPCK